MSEFSKSEREFFQLMEALGSITSTQLNEFVINLYFEALKQFDFEKVNKALMAYMMETDNYSKIPTINQIKSKMGFTGVSKELQAREVSAKILSAVSKFGYAVSLDDVKIADVKKYVGPIGWKVIDLQGGWNAVCESVTNMNKATYQAQWRDLAISIIERKSIDQSQICDTKISGLISEVSQACSMCEV